MVVVIKIMAWRQSRGAANKAENIKHQSYALAYDADTYDFLPLVNGIRRMSGQRTCNSGSLGALSQTLLPNFLKYKY